VGVAERRMDTSHGDASGSSRHVCHACSRMGMSSKTRSTSRAVVRGEVETGRHRMYTRTQPGSRRRAAQRIKRVVTSASVHHRRLERQQQRRAAATARGGVHAGSATHRATGPVAATAWRPTAKKARDRAGRRHDL